MLLVCSGIWAKMVVPTCFDFRFPIWGHLPLRSQPCSGTVFSFICPLLGSVLIAQSTGTWIVVHLDDTISCAIVDQVAYQMV